MLFLLFYFETFIVNYQLFTHIHLAYIGEKNTPKFGAITKGQLGQNMKLLLSKESTN